MTEMTDLTEPTNNALEIRNVSKHFGATIALSGVDLTVRRGEVHALLGENGSGKSTLVKVLAGVYDPEPGGSLRVGDRDVPLPLAPGEFRDIGLSFVHQDLGLARPLTVLENLVGGVSDREESSRWRIRWRREIRMAREMLSSYGVDIDPRAIMDRLPPVGQALVAIARAAEDLKRYRGRTGATASVLVLDEPTVFLPEDELSFLFDLIRSVVASGSSVIFISHDLAAVREIADRVTVLRDGHVVATGSMSDVSDETIVEYIVGQAAAQELDERTSAPIERRVASGQRSEVRLQVTGLRGERVKDLDLTVGAGEIVGLAGLMGSGAEEVPYLLFGSGDDASGELTVDGRETSIARLHPAKAVSLGIAMIPADRNRDAIAREVSVSENMMLLVIREFWRGGRLRNRSVRQTADERADLFDIRPRDTARPAGTLSGGNAQKVVLAKWLEIEPRVLLLHEPTQGVDVAARSQIYRIIQEATQSGMSVLWASTDFDELATVCDRVEVMSNGFRSATLDAERLTQEQITTAVFEGATGAPHVPGEAAASVT